MEAGCKAAGDDLGVDVVVVGPGAESDIEGQVSMIEQQIGAGCDAIVCAPNDAGAAQGALQAAIDAGIPVLAVDTNVGIAGQTSFVGTSNVDAAYEGGKWAIEQAGTDAKAVIIYGQEGDNTSNMRMEGYEKACTEAGVEVLAKLSGNNLTDGATKAMEDLLSAYPDQIDIVLCHNDDTAIGAMNACKSAGVSDITIVGFDGNASAVKLILDGELETALRFAAERGVDVHLILPGKPDKWFVYALAKTHYKALISSGVKISEWSPGFVHAKVFVVDGREAVVGTINLDYRSLYHHFEDAVWMVDAPCIRDIEQDFQHTLEQCRAVENTSASIWQKHYLLRATGMLLKVIAPLL